MNLNRYTGKGSHSPWHCDNDPLFGPQNSPKLTVSMNLGYSVEFQVRRRALDDAPSPTRLDHGDLLGHGWSCRDRSMYIVRCLSCRVLGLTLRSVG